MAYNQFAFEYTSGRAANVIVLIWSLDRTKIRTSGSTMTALTALHDNVFAHGALTVTEIVTQDSTKVGVYRAAAFPSALPADYYVLRAYDVSTPSDSSPGPADLPLALDATGIVYWNGTSLSDSATAGTSVPSAGGGSDATLGLDYNTLLREVGRFLGYDRDPGNWEPDQLTDVVDVVRSGLRNFYYPTLPEPYAWSFMRPATTLSVSQSTEAYTLPTAFGGLVSEGFTYAFGTQHAMVSRAGEEDIRAMYASSSAQGPPAYYSIRPRAQVAGAQQLYEVLFYPIPDAAYTLSYRFATQPPAIDGTNIYPMGGSMHAETILESCLAVAETKFDDEPGVHSQRFQVCLAASVQIDRGIN